MEAIAVLAHETLEPGLHDQNYKHSDMHTEPPFLFIVLTVRRIELLVAVVLWWRHSVSGKYQLIYVPPKKEKKIMQ